MGGMPQHCHRRTNCRLCQGERLTLAFSLTPTPPANAFVGKEALNSRQESFPLNVYFCDDCFHVQLLDVVDPSVLFENYVYVSGTSPVFVAHFKEYAKDLINRFSPPRDSLAVDIGSNDGTLLGFFRDAGLRVLGVDPARDIARMANERGIETLPEFFSPELATKMRADYGPASLVTANNVFAHIDDLRGVVAGVRELLAPDGVFAFEVSYLVDVYEKTLFDTIYHEHLDYHTVKPLRDFFAANDLEMIEAARSPSHGGSLRGMAQLSGADRPVGASVGEMVQLEERLGLDRVETLIAFADRIDALGQKLGSLLAKLKAEGKSIAGFGAPAKATTLMYHFGIGPDIIDFIVDDSPLKQGLFSPGYHVPVLSSESIYNRKPDYLLILAWNFAEPIMANHKAFTAGGGRFIVPLPELEIY